MTNTLKLCVLLAAALGAIQAQQYVISTVAGGAPHSASAAENVAVDATGNIYFTGSHFNNSVFKLDPSGTVTRVAGNSRTDFSGDGGPATNASLSGQRGLAIDRAGNLYIADTGNQRIRRVSPEGIITTVAGGGFGLGDGGTATSAQLNFPGGLAVDRSGNLFIGELGRVRKVTPAGIITTFAGGNSGGLGDGGPATSARLNYASGLGVDDAGNLFILDTDDDGDPVIRKVSSSGTIITVAGNEGVNGICCAGGMTVDGAGNLFYAANPGAVQKIPPSGSPVIVAGNGNSGFSGDGGPATKAQLADPIALAVDGSGNLFIIDGYFLGPQQRIRKVSSDGIITTVAGGALGSVTVGTGDGDPATSVQLQLTLPGYSGPSGVSVDAAGELYIAETLHHRVRKVSPAGIITTVAGIGPPCPSGLPDSCLPLGDGGPATSAVLSYPSGVAVDSQGNLFIADTGDARVRKISPDGIISTVAGNGSSGDGGDGGPATSANVVPVNVVVDASGNLFIGEGNYGRVRKVSPDGTITTVSNIYGFIFGVAVDSQGDLFIADEQCDDDDFSCSQAIQKLSTSGVLSTVVGSTTSLCGPIGMAVDRAGNLLIAEPLCNRIRNIAPNGVITTIAGGSQGYSGDGGLSVNASLNFPSALAVDSAGDVYITDEFNQAIRALRPVSQSISAIVDAASQKVAPVSPGKIVVIYGLGLGPAVLVQNQPVGGQFGNQADGTSVSFSGIPAPILYSSGTQVAAVVPYAVTGASAQVTVSYQGSTSNAFTIPVSLSAPSLFTSNQTGAGQAAALNEDGSVNTAANPVRAGDYISLYATGEGQTSPAGADGKLGGSVPVLPVAVTIDGLPAPLQYAGGASGQVSGLMQVNVQVPAGVQPGGYVPVVLQVGDVTTVPGAVWIAVTN
jgi:uncharacterized protein (TIGR03437 family)